HLERYGVTPTLTIAAGKNTKVALTYENFRDTRGADRGITSFQGRPLDVARSTFFGNPDLSNVRALVNIGTVLVEHQAGAWNIRNRTLIGDYDRGYQNFVPGAVSADKLRYSLSAYNNATGRRNIFNQTDASRGLATGSIRHTILIGAEEGR